MSAMMRVALRPSFRNAVLNTIGVVAYYRFGEAAGTVCKDECGTGDGTYTGSPTLAVSGLLAGDPNTAMSTAGVSGQYVAMPAAVKDCLNGTAWTFILNTIIRSNTTHGLLLGPKGGTSARCFGSRFNGTAPGTSETHLGWAEENVAVISGTFMNVPLNQRYMLANTYGAGVLTGYMDGVLSVAGPITYAWTANFTGTVTISSTTSGADGSEDAVFDEFAFFNRRLAADEIARLAQFGRGF